MQHRNLKMVSSQMQTLLHHWS